MNLFARLFTRAKPTIVREHAAGLVDPDDGAYRPLSGNPTMDELMSEASLTKQRRKARLHYHRNPTGGALVDSLVAKALGEGARYQAADPRVQVVVDRFIQDPDNDLPTYLPIYAKEKLAFGELALPVFLTPVDATVRLGYLLPDEIETVVFRRGDRKKALALVQRRTGPGESRRLWIIPSPDPRFDNRYPPHPALREQDEPGSVTGEDGLPVALPTDADGRILLELAELLSDTDLKVAGYCFYHRHGNLACGRGRSIYERISDWLTVLEQFLFNQFRNAILQGSMLWHVVMKGATRDQVEQRRQEIGRPPRPGSLLVTNDSETWSPLAPNMTPAAQVRELHTSALKLIGISAGLPGHELGAEDDVNRSTAAESRSVSTNRAKALQRDLTAMVRAWIGYQVDQKVYRGMLPEDVDRTVEVVLAELDVRDQSEVSQAVKTMVDAMIMAVDRELVLEKDARAAVYTALGMELPAEADFRQQLRDGEDLRAVDLIASTGTRLRQRLAVGTGGPIQSQQSR